LPKDSLSIFWVKWLVLSAAAVNAQEVGSQVCATCHSAIARKYSGSAMARTSGRVGTGTFRESWENASFRDSSSGAQHHIRPGDRGYTLSFERSATDVRGERRLEWYLGSGRVGRSYLFSQDGFLYQSPVSYYSVKRGWGVSPGYQQKTTIDLTRAIEPACLQCHASRLQPVAGTQNRFAQVPFLDNGVSCERCHGPGQRHVGLMQKAAAKPVGGAGIVNPSKLPAARRDSVCAQCHLTGAARVARRTARTGSYRPGDLLTDSVGIFVWSDARTSPLTVTSHFEKLFYSSCKEKSGDRLWCVSCHDPHGEPADRVAYYRERCLTCHASKPCRLPASERSAANNDCQSCHMPKADVVDSEHAVYTDHSIPRSRSRKQDHSGGERRLIPFWLTSDDSRDAALAHAVVALTDPGVRRLAFDLLQTAVNRDPDDMSVAAQAAQFYDRMGQHDRALPLFERVVEREPANVAAAINLGALYAQKDRLPDAIRIWESTLERNPALTGARINLAVAQARTGMAKEAAATLRLALAFDPDSSTARRLLAQMTGER
jgi:Flp pilus assembly protein TadD